MAPFIQGTLSRRLFDQFASGVAYITVTKKNGDQSIGTCFHIGDNIYVTARHVVENMQIDKVATTNTVIRREGRDTSTSHTGGEATKVFPPCFHNNPKYDVAAFKVEGINVPSVPLAPIYDDEFGNDLLLQQVMIMGYPPIPGSMGPRLVCARTEVNATIESYLNKHRMYIVSGMARGGFSGGPVLTTQGFSLGVIAQAMVKNEEPAELGFMTVIGTLPIMELIDQHGLMSLELRERVWQPHTDPQRGYLY